MVSLEITPTITNQGYSSDDSVTCYDEYTNPYPGAFVAEAHVADQASGEVVGSRSFDNTCMNPSCQPMTTWWAYMSGVVTPHHCFRAYVSGQTVFYSNGLTSSEKCAGADPVCTVTTYIDTDGTITDGPYQNTHVACGSYQQLTATASTGFHFVRWDGTFFSADTTVSFTASGNVTETAHFASDQPPPPDSGGDQQDTCNPQCSPIVINLGSGPYQLSSPGDPAAFDLNADSRKEWISWTAAGAPMAFLALDRNHNGAIDDGRELFGDRTELPTGAPARNGFESLAQYDLNGDGMIDAQDPIWSSLLLWVDANHDGVSQESEMMPVRTSAVVTISLEYHWTGRRNRFGNTFRYQSQVWIDELGGGPPVPRPVFDIFFVSTP